MQKDDRFVARDRHFNGMQKPHVCYCTQLMSSKLLILARRLLNPLRLRPRVAWISRTCSLNENGAAPPSSVVINSRSLYFRPRKAKSTAFKTWLLKLSLYIYISMKIGWLPPCIRRRNKRPAGGIGIEQYWFQANWKSCFATNMTQTMTTPPFGKSNLIICRSTAQLDGYPRKVTQRKQTNKVTKRHRDSTRKYQEIPWLKQTGTSWHSQIFRLFRLWIKRKEWKLRHT
jgi:hypothetical protein